MGIRAFRACRDELGREGVMRVAFKGYYLQHLEYMRLNPYKHQLVNDENEPWRWWFVLKPLRDTRRICSWKLLFVHVSISLFI